MKKKSTVKVKVAGFVHVCVKKKKKKWFSVLGREETGSIQGTSLFK